MTHGAIKPFSKNGHRSIGSRLLASAASCKLQVAVVAVLQLEAALTVSPPAVPVPTGNGYSGVSI